jgi:hypothetical protein
MAIKDLAVFKLFGSAVKKGKDILKKPKKREPEATLGIVKKVEDTEKEIVKTIDSSKEKESESKVVDTPEATKKYIKDDKDGRKKVEKEASKTEDKKKSVKSKDITKKVTSKKGSQISKKDEKIKLYTKDIKKHLGAVDDEFLAIVVKNLGPSIYRKDAELVGCSDPKELDTVRRNFLIKKLGFDKSDNEMLDNEIQKVCESLKGVRKKYRATFYYMLAKNLNKESALS